MQVSELITAGGYRDLIGRERELATLGELLADSGPRVAHLYGDPGIGKTALAIQLANLAKQRGAEYLFIDGRETEPTSRGFLNALGAAIDCGRTDRHSLIDVLAGREHNILLLVDNYEALRLLDSWLRQDLIPALPANIRIALVGRHRPAVGWYSHGWDKLTLILPLGPLNNRAAQALLQHLGIAGEQCNAIGQQLHGHPLAIQLAASTLRYRPGLQLPQGSLQQVMNELSRVYFADIHDQNTRLLLEAAALVRRITVPLLQAMLPQHNPDHAYAQLQQVDFTEALPDGLSLHDAIKTALAQTFRARNPQQYTELRRRAWQTLVQQTNIAPRSDLWRYTADILYLIENPIVREAFFPTGAGDLSVEATTPRDGAAVGQLIEQHEGPESATTLLHWWQKMPEAFVVARDINHTVKGICCRFNPADVDPAELQRDPICQAWQQHLQDAPMPPDARALFIRRWLDIDSGEAPCDSQAALWLDLKRTYMAMRPALRRVYLTLRDMQPYASVAEKLGFQPLPQYSPRLDGHTYTTAVLDFGNTSVDGWLAQLAAAELGIQNQPGFLDRQARELVHGNQRTALTPLEFKVLTYLIDRPGEAVSREQLLQQVWNTDYTGWSNKVDAVVAALRRKLGDYAKCVETVSGVGYRFRESGNE